jgi:hypothetical protein
LRRAGGRQTTAVLDGAGTRQYHFACMAETILCLDPDVKPPEYRVPRGRSGIGSQSALDTLLQDLERIRRAKEAYGELPMRADQQQLRF